MLAGTLSLHDREPMPQRKVLERQVSVAAQSGEQTADESETDIEHGVGG